MVKYETFSLQIDKQKQVVWFVQSSAAIITWILWLWAEPIFWIIHCFQMFFLVFMAIESMRCFIQLFSWVRRRKWRKNIRCIHILIHNKNMFMGWKTCKPSLQHLMISHNASEHYIYYRKKIWEFHHYEKVKSDGGREC